MSGHTDPVANLSTQRLSDDLTVATTCFYSIAKWFSELPPSQYQKTFIYTGNNMIKVLFPMTLSLAVGKTAAAYILEVAAVMYGKHGGGKQDFWYYADERSPVGQMAMHTNAEAHVDFYWELANRKNQGPWNATFVPGKGYVDFDSGLNRALLSLEGLSTAQEK